VSSAVTPAGELAARAGSLLSPLMDVQAREDGSIGFNYGGALYSLRAVNLADELDVLTVIGVLAWDLDVTPVVRDRIAEANDGLEFGTLSIIEREGRADVLLRYTFPAATLTDDALTTMLLLVVSCAESARNVVLAR
jgi:hypothetical protein